LGTVADAHGPAVDSRGEARQGPGRTCSGADEDETSYPLRHGRGDDLGDYAADRVTHQIDLVELFGVEHSEDGLGQPGRTGHRRPVVARGGRVEVDRVARAFRKSFHGRGPELPATEPRVQEYRRYTGRCRPGHMIVQRCATQSNCAPVDFHVS